MSLPRPFRIRFLPLLLLPAFLAPAAARAADCAGPAECCAATPAEQLEHPQVVSLGVVVVGLYNVSEKSGTWDADYYLYESWPPQKGFAPQTEIVNEVARLSEQFGTLARRGDHCIRSRRIRSTLSSPLDLRVFPFDTQRLVLQVSDSWFDSTLATYAPRPFVEGLDDTVYRQLSQWEVAPQMGFVRESRAFKWEKDVWEEGLPVYDYATFSLTVRRHTLFHLTKFFLPLLVIVMVALSVFWVDPRDLASQVGIGVTCLLAAIAFQLSQAATLPEVSYLTLADLVFVTSYLAIALALVESLVSNGLARRDAVERALRLDQRCRWLFPLAFVLLIAASTLVSFHQVR